MPLRKVQITRNSFKMTSRPSLKQGAVPSSGGHKKTTTRSSRSGRKY